MADRPNDYDEPELRAEDKRKISLFRSILSEHIHSSLSEEDVKWIEIVFGFKLRTKWVDSCKEVRKELKECLNEPESVRIAFFEKLNEAAQKPVFNVDKYRTSCPSDQERLINEDCEKYFDAIFDKIYIKCADEILTEELKIRQGVSSPRVSPRNPQFPSEAPQKDPFVSEQELMDSLSLLRREQDCARKQDCAVVLGSKEESRYCQVVTSARWRNNICTVSYREDTNAPLGGGLDKSQLICEMSLSNDLIIKLDDLLTVEEKAEKRSNIELCKRDFNEHRQHIVNVLSGIVERMKRNKGKPYEQAQCPTVSTAPTSIEKRFPAESPRILQEEQVQSERYRKESDSRVQFREDSAGGAQTSAAGTSTSSLLTSTEKFLSPKKRMAAKYSATPPGQLTRHESVACPTETAIETIALD